MIFGLWESLWRQQSGLTRRVKREAVFLLMPDHKMFDQESNDLWVTTKVCQFGRKLLKYGSWRTEKTSPKLFLLCWLQQKTNRENKSNPKPPLKLYCVSWQYTDRLKLWLKKNHDVTDTTQLQLNPTLRKQCEWFFPNDYILRNEILEARGTVNTWAYSMALLHV